MTATAIRRAPAFAPLTPASDGLPDLACPRCGAARVETRDALRRPRLRCPDCQGVCTLATQAGAPRRIPEPALVVRRLDPETLRWVAPLPAPSPVLGPPRALALVLRPVAPAPSAPADRPWPKGRPTDATCVGNADFPGCGASMSIAPRGKIPLWCRSCRVEQERARARATSQARRDREVASG